MEYSGFNAFDDYRRNRMINYQIKDVSKPSYKMLMRAVMTPEIKAELSRRDRIKFRLGKHYDKNYYGK